MPESQRKKRQRGRRDPAEEAAAAVSASLAHRTGVTVEENPAGDWRTLGFNVAVPSDYDNRAVAAVGNELLALPALARLLADSDWQWLVGIYRDGELVSVLKPGDPPSLACPVCAHLQGVIAAVCVRCGSALADER